MEPQKYKWNKICVSYTRSGKGMPVITSSSRHILPRKNIFVLLCFIFSFDESKLDEFMLPGGSDGKESACSAGDLSLSPGLGRSPGEGHGNPLQYSCLENPTDRETWQAAVPGVAELDMTEQLTLPRWERAGEGNPTMTAQSSPILLCAPFRKRP